MTRYICIENGLDKMYTSFTLEDDMCLLTNRTEDMLWNGITFAFIFCMFIVICLGTAIGYSISEHKTLSSFIVTNKVSLIALVSLTIFISIIMLFIEKIPNIYVKAPDILFEQLEYGRYTTEEIAYLVLKYGEFPKRHRNFFRNILLQSKNERYKKLFLELEKKSIVYG